MGLFSTPTDSADSFVSSVFGFGRSDFAAKPTAYEQRPYDFNYDRPIDRYLYREPEAVQSQRYDPLNFESGYYQQQPQQLATPMQDQLPLVKQPSTLEALRKASRPLHSTPLYEGASAESTPVA